MTEETTIYREFQQLQAVCLKQNIPFASYRRPLENEITTLVQHGSFPEKLESSCNLSLQQGFVVAPFVESENHGAFLLRPESIFSGNDIDPEFTESLKTNNRFLSLPKPSATGIETTTRQEFTGQVEAAVSAMKNGEFNKTVLSKIRREALPEGFNAPDFFEKLCSAYPHAFVYLIQLPEVGCWMGATPEPLLVVENGKVKTVSLAGTQLATDTANYSWTEKEIEEQGIVTEFVEQTLQSLGVEKYSKTGPENYRAANLIHLRTAFEFPEAEMQNRLGEFLKALHPTPSVGGLPKDEACNFILQNEKHDRSYYTGYLGTININSRTDIFVNLRCLQLFEKQFVLYSGAGITASSIAEKEWEETENKMMTLMNVMMKRP